MKTKTEYTGALNRTLALRIHPDTLALIMKLASDRCVSKSFITRQLIEAGLSHFGISAIKEAESCNDK